MTTHQDQNTNTQRKCLNCGAVLTGPYCAQCGQKDLPKRLTLKELILSFIDSFTSFDSKFFKTFKYLLLYPGFLASEYNAGRREQYFPPIRGYIFLSFIFFFLYFSLPDRTPPNRGIRIYSNSKDSTDYKYRQEGVSVAIDSFPYSSIAEFDSIQQTLPTDERNEIITRLFIKGMIEYRNHNPGSQVTYAQALGKTFVNNIPKVLFFLLPVFALWLKILYYRTGTYYSEHLVFSITCYNFYYLLFSMVMLIELIPRTSWFPGVAIIGLLLYFAIGLKRVYHQGWPKTLLKMAIFGIVFGFSILIALAINAIVSLMII